MNSVNTIFDKWAKNGRDELMEKEHGKNVMKFLETISFDKPFLFLDVGCGNGWVVRKIAEENNCKKAIGIDKSKNMILQANAKKKTNKEKYICKSIESLRYKNKFDFIFSMESLYYVDSIEIALEKIYKLLKPGGQFF
jgi:2-polyprenyl-3-methyl-5-hydroxy-6-metoxy-1,4-benzoquinol methylase